MLKQAAFSASRWASASTLAATGLQLVQTIVLARLLLPQDFGQMAVVGATLAVLSLLVDMGLSQALIHYDDVSRNTRSSIYWLNLTFAAALMFGLMLAAPLLGAAYQSEELVPLLRWSSLVFPLAAASQQLRALAAKNLRFDQLAPIDMAASMTSLACAIVAALAGAGVYALVAGLLVRAGVASALAWILLPADYRPTAHFQPREAQPYLGFGAYLVGETLANEGHRHADIFAGGLALGSAAMGVYAVPRDLSMQASRVLNSVVTRVGFPVMARVKDDIPRVRNIYLQTLRMTASVNFPLYVFLGTFATEVVNLLYGSKWQHAIMYLQILAVWGLLRSIGNPAGSLLYATGRTRRAFFWNLGLLALLPPLYWLATFNHGLTGLACGALALQFLLVVPSWRFLIRPCCGAGLGEYLAQLLPPLLCAMTAGLAAWGATQDLPHGTLRLVLGTLVGGLVYIGISWLFNRSWVDAMWELLCPMIAEKQS